MISDVDIKDWESINIQRAEHSLNNLTHAVGSVVFYEDLYNLKKFIKEVELLRRKQVQQVPALFKEKNG
jgi:predicted oxidoreductase (fatty acid repression mutant protein)